MDSIWESGYLYPNQDKIIKFDNCNLAKSDKCFKGGIVKDGEQQNKG